MLNIGLFQTTRRLVMAPGALNQLADEVKRLDASRVMLITDPGLVEIGLAERTETLLAQAGLTIVRFSDIEPDPSIETALQAAAELKKAEVQAVVGLGGGSALDVAKIASIMAVNEGPLDRYIGVDLVPRPGLPLILVPTTAGTGSEVTPIAILSDEKEKLKKGVVSPHLFPQAAVLDPELTLGLPPHITAATGMDAFIHALEAYTSKKATGLTDLMAWQAMDLAVENIGTAFADGANLEARTAMMEASLLAGIAFANAGVAAVHAFAYPIGAEFHIPHGVANSIMLVPVLEFNLMGNLDKYADLAGLFGRADPGLGPRRLALEAVRAIRELTDDLEVPSRLGQFGVTEADLPGLAEAVLKVTRLLANNPRQINRGQAEEVYRRAL